LRDARDAKDKKELSESAVNSGVQNKFRIKEVRQLGRRKAVKGDNCYTRVCPEESLECEGTGQSFTELSHKCHSGLAFHWIGTKATCAMPYPALHQPIRPVG
jgi:hypothetical protein